MSQPTHSRRQPVQQRARKTWNRILDATVAILTQEGADTFTTNHVAKVAGISVGTLYGYFSDKEAIAAALIARQAQREAATLLARFDTLGRAPLEQLANSLIQLVFDLYQKQADLYRALQALKVLDREAIGTREHELRIIAAIAEQLISRGWQPERAQDTAHMTFCVVEALAFRSITSSDTAKRRIQRETATMIERYLGL